jgi:hypothetical protein
MPDEKPLADLLVGDRFWLGYAQELVKAAVSAPDRRAEQLINGIAWFWTVYSAAVLVVFTTRSQAPPLWISIILVSPTVLLVVAYWVASRVRVPILIEFDPRVPSQIEAAHSQAVSRKNQLLSVAEGVTALAAVCVVAAGVVALFTGPTGKTELHGYVNREGAKKLLVLGTFPKEAVVRVVEAVKGAAVPVKELSQLQRASEKGELRTEIDVPEAEVYRVTATWNEEKVEKSITISVRRDD